MESASISPRPQSRRRPSGRRLALACVAASLIGLVQPARTAELIYQEGFNDDGEAATPRRYTTTGRFTSEHPHDPGIVASAGDQVGPVFWGHSSEVSIVGVYGPTPERRALLAWDAAIQEGDVSPQFWTLFDAAIDWLLRGKANATVLISADSTSAQSLADRLTGRGHSVVDDDISVPDSAVVADLIIKTPNNLGTPGRFARVAKPLLTFSALDHDDLLVSTIGATATFEAGNATIVNAAHPAAGGLTGSFPAVSGSYTWQLIGENLPSGATTVATLSRSVPPTAASLADVDAMIAGSKPSDRTEETVDTLDFSDGSPGDWFWDFPVPGGATGVWGLQATGQLQVTANGTYSFALGMDDGARLRIDRDGNGFSDADNVIVEDAAGGHRARYGTVQLNTGTYAFEVVAFNSGGGGSLELSVSTQTGAADTSPISSGTWELLGETSGGVALQGAITAASYVPTGDPETVTVPLLVLLNGPEDSPAGSVYGGGAFTGFEGTGFFGGAALNKFDSDGSGTTKTLTLPPVNVAGKENVRLTIAVAGTFLDFETDDFLAVWIDPNNSGNFSQLIRFTAPSGNDKYFDDRLTNPGNPTRLDLEFQDVTYPIPAGATDLVIEVRAFTTWFNEIVAFDNIRVTAGDDTPPPPPADLVPATFSIGAVPASPGTGLHGRYWLLPPKSITTLLGPAGVIETVIRASVPPTATFLAKIIDYTGNDLTPLETWLGPDAPSLDVVAPGNLDDGLIAFNGWIAIREPGQVQFGTPSDDGTVVVIGERTVINNDGSHGAPGPAPNGTATFEAPGLYPISITYFNGDWVNDEGTEHGGANIQFTSNGAAGIGAPNAIVPTAVLYNGNDLRRVPAATSLGDPPAAPGTGLSGRYWQRAPKELTTLLGPTGAVETITRRIAPTATFLATAINYSGNDLTPVETWLGPDAASLSNPSPGNLDDGLFAFNGWIAITAPGPVQFGTPSDDGTVVRIGGVQVIDNDGSHGAPGPNPNGTVTFEAAGLYPIEIHYFNGDWVNDEGTEHGGASIQFTSNGAGGIGSPNAVVPVRVLYPASGATVELRIGSIALANGTVTITWTGPGRLQSAPDVNGPYTDVAGASSPYTAQASAADRRYYRLAQ